MGLRVRQGRQITAENIGMLEQLSSLKGLVCVEKTGFFKQDNAAILIVCRSKDYFQADFIPVLDHPPCSLDSLKAIENLWECHGTFIKMEHSLRLWILSTKLCSPPGETFRKPMQSLVSSMPQAHSEFLKSLTRMVEVHTLLNAVFFPILPFLTIFSLLV